MSKNEKTLRKKNLSIKMRFVIFNEKPMQSWVTTGTRFSVKNT